MYFQAKNQVESCHLFEQPTFHTTMQTVCYLAVPRFSHYFAV